MEKTNQDLLVRGALAMGVELPAGAIEKLSVYLEILEKWSQKMNLTSVGGERSRVVRLLIDSLAVVPLIREYAGEASRVMDAGSGAGLPGIPLAAAMPEAGVVLAESRGKRAAFLRAAVRGCGLDNTRVLEGRAEDAGEGEFGAVTARAAGGLGWAARIGSRALVPGGVVLAMKGPQPEDEMDRDKEEIERAGLEVAETTRYQLPEDAGKRALVVLRKKQGCFT